jgi:hypothetical protein
MNKDELIDAIVQIEWPMFAGVNNEGGKAACQMDLATFRIMRISQYSAWGEELLESCLADLRAAQNQGRNLMTEKYARMMKTTFPDEYSLRSILPLHGRSRTSWPAMSSGKRHWIKNIPTWETAAVRSGRRKTGPACLPWKPIPGQNCKPARPAPFPCTTPPL